MFRRKGWICLWISLFGCESESLRTKGEWETKKLVEELSVIETREELEKAVPRVKKRLSRLADLLIEARQLQREGEEPFPSSESERLFLELARLYEEPWGRELVESAQIEAIEKLSSFGR